MGKKIAIGAVLVGFVLVALGVIAFFNLNALLEQNRDRIASLASDAAGREVAFEAASVGFSKGLAIRIDGLRVAEDPRFGKTDFLVLESGFVEVALWPALQRRIEVRGIRLERPVIQLIETKQGYNFSSLGAKDTKASKPEQDEDAPPMVLVIGALAISDGKLVYADRTSKDGLALTIEALETSGANLTLDGPLAIDFSGRIRPTKGDASLASVVSGRFEIEDRATGAGRLQLESPSFAPRIFGVELSEDDEPERIEGLDLTVEIPANADRAGYPIALRAETARLAGFDVEKIDGQLLYRGSKLEIERFVLGLAGGQAELDGDLAFGAPGQSPFDLDLKVRDLDSDELAHVLLGVPRGAVSGRLGGEFDLVGASLDRATLERTLAGRVRLEVGTGALESVNVLDALATQLLGSPGLGEIVANSLREVAPESLRGERTPFDRLLLAVDVDGGRLRADDLQIAAKDFGLTASGALGLDGLLDGDGRIRFSPEMSRKILKQADRFAPLLAEGDVVVLPFKLGGKLSAPSLRPDLSALSSHAREVATEELREKAANKLTDAIFGKKKKKKDRDGDPATDGEASPDAEASGDDAGTNGDASEEGADESAREDRDRESTKDLVKEGLERLLGN